MYNIDSCTIPYLIEKAKLETVTVSVSDIVRGSSKSKLTESKNGFKELLNMLE